MDFTEKQLFKIFSQIESPEPRFNLTEAVIQRIRRRRFWLFMPLAVSVWISLAIFLVFLGQQLIASFSNSGFFQFLSLIFFDAEAVLLYWQSFVFSLLETLPVMSILIFCLVFLSLLFSLKIFVQGLKKKLATI